MSIQKVGLLISDDMMPKFWAECLEQMVQECDVEITHIVLRNDKYLTSSANQYSLFDSLERLCSMVGVKKAETLLSIYRRKGSWVIMAIRDYLMRQMYNENPIHELKQQQSINDNPVFADATRIKCDPNQTDGKWVELPDPVVTELTDSADVVIQMGFGLLEGRILTEPEYGLLSFHYGDVTEYRGAPTGFWEFIDDAEHAKVTVQQLTHTLDGGKIVTTSDVDLSTALTWDDVRGRLFETSIPMLATAIKQLEDPDFEPEPPQELGELHTWSEAKRLDTMGRCICYDFRGLVRHIFS
jgi:hypothetical protein